MTNSRVLTGLLLVLALAIGASLWLWGLPGIAPQPPRAHPADPAAAGAPVSADADQLPATSETVAPSAAQGTAAPAERVRVLDPLVGDDRACTVQVLVEYDLTASAPGKPEPGKPEPRKPESGQPESGKAEERDDQDQRPQPATHVDVSVYLADAPTVRVRGRTDDEGRARFVFVGGHGSTVIAESGAGGRASGVLSATQPTALQMRVRAAVVATGRVVDASGTGVEAADVVLLRWPNATAAKPADGNRATGSTGGRSSASSYGAIADATLAAANQSGSSRSPRRPAGSSSSLSSSLSGSGHAQLWRVGKSRRDGTFSIPLATGGRIGAMHADYAPSALYLVRPRRGASAPIPHQSFELPLLGKAASLTGHVRAADGSAAVGARLELHSQAQKPRDAELAAPPQQVLSDGNGGFTVRQLPPGQLHWAVMAAGHGWQQGVITIVRDQPNRLDIELQPPANVTGVVVGPDGKGIGGARVTAGAPDSLCHASTRSAADGSFRLTGLGSGAVALSAALGEARANTTLELQPGAEASWRAVLAVTTGDLVLRGGVVDAAGSPQTGWRVLVRRRGSPVRSAATADDGSFAIAVDQPADFLVTVFAPGRDLTSFANAIARDVDARSGPLRLVVDDFATSVVRGRVVTSDYEAAEAQIGCWHQQRREYARFRTDGDGMFELPVTPVGTIDLTIEHPGHSVHERRSVIVDPGLVTDLGTIQLAPGGGLFGTVIGPDGCAPDTCELSLLTGRSSGIDQSGGRLVADYVGGTYRFANVPPGQHTLQVQGPGLAGTSLSVKVEAGTDRELALHLQRGLRRRILIRTPSDAGDRVSLGLRPQGPAADGEAMHWLATAAVSEDGANGPRTAEFVTFMVAGSYDVVAWTRGGYRASAAVAFRHDDEPDVVLQLRR